MPEQKNYIQSWQFELIYNYNMMLMYLPFKCFCDLLCVEIIYNKKK